MKTLALALMLALGVAPAAAQDTRIQVPVESLEIRAQMDSNDSQAHYNLALGYWSKKRYNEAARALRVAVTIEPRFAAGWLALAYLPYARRPKLLEEEARGRVPSELRDTVVESLRLRRRSFLLDPLVDLRILGAVAPRQGVFVVGRSGRLVIFSLNPFQAFVDGNYSFAFHSFNEAIATATQRGARDSIPEALFWYRGLSAGHLQLYDTAIADFQALLDRASRTERADSIVHMPMRTNDYRYILALFKYRARKFVDAIVLYKEALANDLGLFMAHVQMGRMYEEQHMWQQAIDEFQQAEATNPEDQSLLMDLGVVLREGGRLVESEDALSRAVVANPRDTRALYHLGLTQQQHGEWASARDSYSRFLLLAPSRYGRQITDARERLNQLP